MTPRMWAPVGLFIGGIVLIAVAVASGEADVSLLVIFPDFSGSSPLFLLGTLLIVLSFIVGFVMLALGQVQMSSGSGWQAQETKVQPPGGVRKEYGGVVLLGPVPIAFGSDRRIALIMLVVGIVLAIVFLGVLVALA
jgi:uncharacterized protein (TIGR00304 family)